jgi:D-glycero-alpha-D-manno-heptose 1-phosphate guanylyltransferase
MQLVVLAGGLGTRLRPALAAGVPKSMATVADRPFIDHLLDAGLRRGVDDVVLLTGHGAAVVERHVGSAHRGVRVRHSAEATPLGTGGALVGARRLLDERFVLVNGDTWADVDLAALVACLDRAPLALGLTRVDDAGRFGRVEVTGDVVVRLVEKGRDGPALINAGVYACRRELLDELPDTGPSSFERDLLEPLLSRLRPRWVPAGPDFFDIGVPDDLAAADRHLRALRHHSTWS